MGFINSSLLIFLLVLLLLIVAALGISSLLTVLGTLRVLHLHDEFVHFLLFCNKEILVDNTLSQTLDFI